MAKTIINTFTTTTQAPASGYPVVSKGLVAVTFASTGSVTLQVNMADNWRNVDTWTTDTVESFEFAVPAPVRFNCTDATGNVTVEMVGKG